MLELTMHRVQARERLDDRSYSGSLDTAAFYRLLLDAGYTPSVAQKAANERGWQRLNAGAVL